MSFLFEFFRLVAVTFLLNSHDFESTDTVDTEEEEVDEESWCPAYCDFTRAPDQSILRHARFSNSGFLMMGLYENLTRDQSYAIAQELHALGQRAILSFTPLPDSLVEALDHYEIEMIWRTEGTRHSNYWNFHWYQGYDPFWGQALLQSVNTYGVNSVTINCLHGVDRTGNASAFLMSILGDYTIVEAMYSVVSTSPASVRGLDSVMREFGVARPRDYHYLLGTNTYGSFGMKAHREGYLEYIRETITMAIEYGGTLQ